MLRSAPSRRRRPLLDEHELGDERHVVGGTHVVGDGLAVDVLGRGQLPAGEQLQPTLHVLVEPRVEAARVQHVVHAHPAVLPSAALKSSGTFKIPLAKPGDRTLKIALEQIQLICIERPSNLRNYSRIIRNILSPPGSDSMRRYPGRT